MQPATPNLSVSVWELASTNAIATRAHHGGWYCLYRYLSVKEHVGVPHLDVTLRKCQLVVAVRNVAC